MKNRDLAQLFRQIAEILEIVDENPFRIRAYLRAAQNIESLSQDIAELAENDNLTEIPGIGADLAEKIKEFTRTGRLKFYEQLRKKVPAGLTALMDVPGLGPKTAKVLFNQLKIKNLDQLEQAARAHKISALPGLKLKTEQNILRGIALRKKAQERMLLVQALAISVEFVQGLRKLKIIKKICPAGSLRRKKETVRDIDILVTSPKRHQVMSAFTSLPQVKQILTKGATKSSVLTKSGIGVDLRVVAPKSFGAALLYFTGSKEHNIKLRQLARKRGLKINEYGLFKKAKWLTGRQEADIFKQLDLPFIEPELREDRGEITAGLAKKLPRILDFKQIRGDLHVHSRWSDGKASIKDIAQQAQRLGYDYIAITDHSQSLKIAGGLSIERLKRQIALISQLNKKLKKIQILAGVEVDIKSDGNLDYPDRVLKELDIVIAAIHSGFKQDREQISKRIIRAMENRYVHIIAHPSGRLLGQRDAYDLDIERVLQKAKQTQTILEINAFPNRLDLTDINCQRAKELGVKVAISTDAHMLQQLHFMNLGVAVARRGWLEKKDIVNCLALERLRLLLKKK